MTQTTHRRTVFEVQSTFHHFCTFVYLTHAICIPCHMISDNFVPEHWNKALNGHGWVRRAGDSGSLRYKGNKILWLKRRIKARSYITFYTLIPTTVDFDCGFFKTKTSFREIKEGPKLESYQKKKKRKRNHAIYYRTP